MKMKFPMIFLKILTLEPRCKSFKPTEKSKVGRTLDFSVGLELLHRGSLTENLGPEEFRAGRPAGRPAGRGGGGGGSLRWGETRVETPVHPNAG